MHVLGFMDTTMYGRTLVAESTNDANLVPVGSDESSYDNWTETTHEDWMSFFTT